MQIKYIVFFCYCIHINKIKKIKNTTVRTVLKSNIKSLNEAKSIPLSKYIRPFTFQAWYNSDFYKKWRINLVLWDQTSSLSEMMLSCKYYMN